MPDGYRAPAPDGYPAQPNGNYATQQGSGYPAQQSGGYPPQPPDNYYREAAGEAYPEAPGRHYRQDQGGHYPEAPGGYYQEQARGGAHSAQPQGDYYPGQARGAHSAQPPGDYYSDQAPGGYPPQAPGRYPSQPPGGYQAEPQPKRGNGFATTSLVFGILPAPLFGIGFGIAGLVRSRSNHQGKIRSWFGIALSLLWVALGIYLVPHIVKLADPGCTSFKGTALDAYNKTINDLNTHASQRTITTDINVAISDINAAEAKSQNATAKSALGALSGQLVTVRADVARGNVPGSVIQTLNTLGDAADTACGTL